MQSEKCLRLLEMRGVRPTANRILLVKALSECQSPVSMAELETMIGTMDRSSIFRGLTVFMKSHVVHLIDDGSDSSKFELCPSTDGKCGVGDMHAHFHCEACGATECIDDVIIPEVVLPPGYSVSSVNYVVKGLCASCGARQRSGVSE